MLETSAVPEWALQDVPELACASLGPNEFTIEDHRHPLDLAVRHTATGPWVRLFLHTVEYDAATETESFLKLACFVHDPRTT